MNRLFAACLATAICGGAGAEVVLYDNLNGSQDGYLFDDDGAGKSYSLPYGSQVGQVVTDTAGGSTLSSVEGYFAGYNPTSAATAMFVQVFEFSGGTVGSLVGSQTVGTFTENDSKNTSPILYFPPEIYDISANVDIGGLVAGSQYLVTMQPQSGNATFLGYSIDGNLDTYVRDFSNFGYRGYTGYGGVPTWTEIGADYGSHNYSGDTVMKIEATAVPEPFRWAA